MASQVARRLPLARCVLLDPFKLFKLSSHTPGGSPKSLSLASLLTVILRPRSLCPIPESFANSFAAPRARFPLLLCPASPGTVARHQVNPEEQTAAGDRHCGHQGMIYTNQLMFLAGAISLASLLTKPTPPHPMLRPPFFPLPCRLSLRCSASSPVLGLLTITASPPWQMQAPYPFLTLILPIRFSTVV